MPSKDAQTGGKQAKKPNIKTDSTRKTYLDKYYSKSFIRKYFS